MNERQFTGSKLYINAFLYVKITTHVLAEKGVTILKKNIRRCFFNYNIIFVEKERNWTQYQKFCFIICFILYETLIFCCNTVLKSDILYCTKLISKIPDIFSVTTLTNGAL